MPSQPATLSTGNRVVFGCLMLLAFVFFSGGAIALVQGMRHYPTENGIVGIIVGGLFTFLGAGAMTGIVYWRTASQKRESRKAEYPDKPWMWREDWANRAIKDSSKGALIVFWGFAIVWNSFAVPVALLMKPQASRENPVTFVIYLFPVAGFLLVIAAIHRTLQNARFGSSILHLDRVPIVPGRMFRGDIELKTDAVPANGYQLRIASFKVVLMRQGNRRTTVERLVWDSEIVVDASAAMRSPMGTRVPFQFATPPDSQPTDDRDQYPHHLWRLLADADLPGVDFSAQYELPVFATGEEVDGTDFAAFQERHRSEAARATIAPSSGVEITRLPAGGERFRIRAKKTFGRALSTLVFLLLWNAAIVAMIHFGAPWGIPAFFIFIDLLLVLSSIDYYFGQSTIDADARGVRVGKQWMGITLGEATYDAASVASVDGTTSGTNSELFGVTLKLSDGKTQRLCSNMADRETADAVAARIMAAMRSRD